MSSCDLGSDRRLLRRFKQLAYDSQDYITLNEYLKTWRTADLVEQKTLCKWEQEGAAERHRTYLEGTCLELLCRYLECG